MFVAFDALNGELIVLQMNLGHFHLSVIYMSDFSVHLYIAFLLSLSLPGALKMHKTLMLNSSLGTLSEGEGSVQLTSSLR